MAAKFEIKAAAGGQFIFNLKAANGEIILTSELYKQKRSAEEGIASVRTNAADDARFERKTAKNGSPFFTLKAANGEIIGKSEMYSSASAMENGISSVKKNAPMAISPGLAHKALRNLSNTTRDHSERVQQVLARSGRKPNPAFVESAAKYYPALKKLAEK